MAYERPGLLTRLGLQNPLRRWSRALQNIHSVPDRTLQAMHQDLQGLRAQIDGMSAEAEAEFLARAGTSGNDGITRPDQCDWAGRPAPWRVPMRPRGHVNFASPLDLGGGVKLFHDATEAELSLRQDPAPGWTPGPRYGFVLEVYRFNGSFLSFVVDLPDAGLAGLTRDHYIAVRLQVAREHPLEIYARLNVQYGPNQEQLVRQFSFDGDEATAEFDLAYSRIKDRRLEKAWLDLILEGPHMTRVAIRDMVLTRAPRADI